jgi:DNA-binding XRE family transcriptional regulator
MQDSFAILKKLGSDQEIAKKLGGVTRQTVHNWRTGRTSPTCDAVYRMCVALRVRPHTFLQGEGFDADAQMVHRMRGDRETPTVEAIGAWMRGRMRESLERAERGFVSDRRHIARRVGMDKRTVDRVLDTDHARWSQMVRVVRHGLHVSPYALFDASSLTTVSARTRYDVGVGHGGF